MAFTATTDLAAGTDVTETKLTNMLKDSLMRVVDGTAGENLSAYTTSGGITFPTIVTKNSTTNTWVKANANGVVLGLGHGSEPGILMLTGASVTTGQAIKVVLPGSLITTEFFPSISGMTVNDTYFTSPVAGAVTNGVATSVAWRRLGRVDTTGVFNFNLIESTTATATDGGMGIFLTSAEAITAGMVVTINPSGKVAQSHSNDTGRYYLGNPMSLHVALNSTTTSDQNIRCAKAGMIATVLKSGGGSWTPGLPVYTNNNYGLASHTPSGQYCQLLGIAVNTTQVLIVPGHAAYGQQIFVQEVTAGAAWNNVAFLYLEKSSGQWKPTDSDIAESGIAEDFGVALKAQSGGAGTRQLIIIAPSVIRGIYALTSGERFYPGPTPGNGQASAPHSLDTFTRRVARAIDTDAMLIAPQDMQYLPTGIQEKGFFAAGGRRDTSMASDGESFTGVTFRKVMVNTPSSITLTVLSGSTGGVTVDLITRWGFCVRATRASTGLFFQEGTYLTVGN